MRPLRNPPFCSSTFQTQNGMGYFTIFKFNSLSTGTFLWNFLLLPFSALLDIFKVKSKMLKKSSHKANCHTSNAYMAYRTLCLAVCSKYTVKKIYGIPVFFFTKPFRNGKTPMLTRDFLVPSREGIFCLLRREKYSSLCKGNFFLSVECYISLFPLFPY